MNDTDKYLQRLINSAKDSIESAKTLVDRVNTNAITLSDDVAILNAASQCTQAARELNEAFGALNCIKWQRIAKVNEKNNATKS